MFVAPDKYLFNIKKTYVQELEYVNWIHVQVLKFLQFYV